MITAMLTPYHVQHKEEIALFNTALQKDITWWAPEITISLISSPLVPQHIHTLFPHLPSAWHCNCLTVPAKTTSLPLSLQSKLISSALLSADLPHLFPKILACLYKLVISIHLCLYHLFWMTKLNHLWIIKSFKSVLYSFIRFEFSPLSFWLFQSTEY